MDRVIETSRRYIVGLLSQFSGVTQKLRAKAVVVSRHPHFFFIITLSVTAVAFWPLMLQFFAIDDFSWLLSSGKGLNTFNDWLTAFTQINGSGQYRPLSQQLFFWLGYHGFGFSPLGFHLLNSATYLIACCLVYGFLTYITNSKPIAAISAALFCLSPVHVEHIMWVSAYTETLATLCVAGALYCLVRDKKNYVVLWYCIGLAANETTIIIPLFVFAYYFIYKKYSLKKSFVETKALWIVLFIYMILRLTLFGGLAAKGVFAIVWSPIIWIQETIHSAQVALGFGPVMDNVAGMTPWLGKVITVLTTLVVVGLLYSYYRSRRSAIQTRTFALGITFFIIGLLPVLPFAHNFADYTTSIPAIGLPLVLIAVIGTEKHVLLKYAAVTFGMVCLFIIHIYSPGGLYRIDGYRRLSQVDYTAYILMEAAYLETKRPLHISIIGEHSETVISGMDELARFIHPDSSVVLGGSTKSDIVFVYNQDLRQFTLRK